MISFLVIFLSNFSTLRDQILKISDTILKKLVNSITNQYNQKMNTENSKKKVVSVIWTQERPK